MMATMSGIEMDEQRMTSLDIAEVTGKPHNDVLKAIRKMEPAWGKVCAGKFSLTSKSLVMPNGGVKLVPFFSLTKIECFFIATKFNDEARAKLVKRWYELECEYRMMKGISIFRHEVFGEIRTMTDEKGEPFFVGRDVAKALGYAKPENALANHVDSEDKTTTLIQGTGSNYKSKTILINESGLYSLILSSKLEQAKGTWNLGFARDVGLTRGNN